MINKPLNPLLYALLGLFLILGLAGFGKNDPKPGQALSLNRQAKLLILKTMQPSLISWPQLMPKDYVPEPQIFSLDLGNKNQRLQNAQKVTPVVQELAGQELSLAGYVVPLAADEKAISEFLLVPFFGACIHVPAPPANQIVHVIPRYPLLFEESWQPILITGVLSIESTQNEYGEVAYLMKDAILTAYNNETMPERQELH